MNEFPFEKFIKLVAFDQATNKLDRELVHFENESIKTQQEINAAKAELDLFKQRFVASKKEVDNKELSMKEFDVKQKEKQRQLERISNSREYQSLAHKIETIKKVQHDYEEGLLSSWHTLEAVTRDYMQKKEEIDNRCQELEKLLEDYSKQKEIIKNTLEEHQTDRSTLEIGIPEEWLEKYAVMRKAVANPVVPVLNGACSACFYTIPQQDIIRLRKHAMLQCKDCYRFLYTE